MFLTTIDRNRDRRTEAILDTLGTGCQPPFHVLDLGSGPGPLAGRLLQRFSGSRVSRSGLGSRPPPSRKESRGAIRTTRQVAIGRLSGKGLAFWAPGRQLRCGRLFARTPLAGGDGDPESLPGPASASPSRRTVVNGDFLPSKKSQNTRHDPAPLSERRPRAANQVQLIQSSKRKWARWWNALEREPALHSAFVARQIRIPGTILPRRTSGPTVPVNVESHVRALRNAGFRETAVTWRDGGFRVLVANA